MIRDVTGLNEARDGSMPDKNALVGIQKIAAANSNTATRHILQSSLYLTLSTAECISMRVSDVIEYSPTRESFIKSLGKFNVATLAEMSSLHLHDFGIFLELAPDEEEKQRLENNIQMALQQNSINLEDAIDIREVRNIKLANQLLKIRRKAKQLQDQQIAQQNIQAQAQANAAAAERASAAEMQKQQALNESKAQIEQVKAGLEMQKLEREAQLKKELMQIEFEMNMQLRQAESNVLKDREKTKEDRKDERTKIQATQQSELIDQRKKDTGPKSFESAGFDNLDGFGLEQFEPR
jgi:DNA polymerase III gamma/tau subunit